MKTKIIIMLLLPVGVAIGAAYWQTAREQERAQTERHAAVLAALNEQRSWVADRKILENQRSLARIAMDAADARYRLNRTDRNEDAAREASRRYIEVDTRLRAHEEKKLPPPPYAEWKEPGSSP